MSNYDALYANPDPNNLNSVISSLLEILSAHEEGTGYDGNYDSTIANAESSLEAATSEDPDRLEGIEDLLKNVKDLGMPVDQDEETDGVRPKRRTS